MVAQPRNAFVQQWVRLNSISTLFKRHSSRQQPICLSLVANFCTEKPSVSSEQTDEATLKEQLAQVQMEHSEIILNEQDLEEKFMRGGGPGGQSVNKTESCVALIHKPTGISVKCQDSRSQYRNRQLARERLKEKIDYYYRGEASKIAQKIAKIRARKANRRRKSVKKHYKSKNEKLQDDSMSSEDLFEQDEVCEKPSLIIRYVVDMPLICPGHSRGIVELNYSPLTLDGYFLVSACLDGYPMLRDGATGNWLGTFVGHKGAVWTACLNSSATLAATGGADFTSRIWNALDGSCLKTFSLQHICRTVSFSQDSTRVLLGGSMKTISIYNLLDGMRTEPIMKLEGHSEIVRFARFFGDSNHMVVSGGDEPFLYIWDTRLGSLVQKLSLEAKLKCAELSNGEFPSLLTVVVGGSIQFWDPTSFRIHDSFSVSEETEAASIHPSGKFVVTGGKDLKIRLYNKETKEIVETFLGHHGPIWCIRFSPLGDSFASGSDDGTIRLWHEYLPFVSDQFKSDQLTEFY
eukprot:jgi/Galph1/2643/GphlegSOOS_G1320.1